MDGVISNTLEFYDKSSGILLGRHGIDLGIESISKEYGGTSTKDFFTIIFEKYKKNEDVMKAVGESEDLLAESAKGKVSAIEGAKELIRELQKENFKLSVASGASIRFLNLVLGELELEKEFMAVVSSDEVQKGKPDPEIFLLATKKMGVSLCERLVIEDGKQGIIAAKKAGMKCVALLKDGQISDLADITIRNLEELTMEKIKDL